MGVSPALLQTIIKEQGVARSRGLTGCFLFNRVSTRMSEQETSLDQQEHDSDAYATRNGLHVVYNFRVQETASKEEHRHAFNEMISLLRSDLINVKHVIFKSADRLSRNRHDKDVLDKLRKLHGISIHYYSSGKVLNGASHYTDELQDDIENLFATHYSRELAHKIKAAYEHKAFAKRQAPGTRPPFGYAWDKNAKTHIIDTDSEHIVRAIHAAFDSGKYSLGDFVTYCNSQKLLPKSGVPWQKGRLAKLLTNPFYTGWFRFHGTELEGSHPAYISRKRFETRLERLSSRQNGIILNRRNHLLSRFVKCSSCGRSYEAEYQTGAHNSGSFTYYKHRCLAEGWISERRLSEEQIILWLDEIVESSRFHPSFAESLKELFRKPLEKQDTRVKKERQAIQARISRLQAQQLKLLDLYTTEEISREELLEKRKQYLSEIDLLKNELRASDTKNETVFDQIVETIDLLREMPLIFLRDTSDGKLKILKTMATSVSLTPDHQLFLNWRSPFSFLMRSEILDAQAKGRVKKLALPGKRGFKKVSDCAQERT